MGAAIVHAVIEELAGRTLGTESILCIFSVTSHTDASGPAAAALPRMEAGALLGRALRRPSVTPIPRMARLRAERICSTCVRSGLVCDRQNACSFCAVPCVASSCIAAVSAQFENSLFA